MGFAQKHARAAISSNLRDDPHHHDHEALAALALVSITDNKLATLIFRVKYSNDASSYPRLLGMWREVVAGEANMRGWPERVNSQIIADAALSHFINDLCRLCGGHGRLRLEGVPNVLQDDPCPACNGTGKRPLACDARITRYTYDMIDVLSRMEYKAGGEAMKKLASEMDF